MTCPSEPARDNGGTGVETLLARVAEGDEAAREELFAALYSSIYARAEALMHRQPAGHTLQATALVNEVYMRLCRADGGGWTDRRHFIQTAAKAMRQVLVDHARRKKAAKRDGGGERHPLDQVIVEYEERACDLEGLHRALAKLSEFDPTMARVIELRFFGGASRAEAARIVGQSQRTLDRQWAATRAWLYRELR